jgi:hypothetical protein
VGVGAVLAGRHGLDPRLLLRDLLLGGLAVGLFALDLEDCSRLNGQNAGDFPLRLADLAGRLEPFGRGLNAEVKEFW